MSSTDKITKIISDLRSEEKNKKHKNNNDFEKTIERIEKCLDIMPLHVSFSKYSALGKSLNDLIITNYDE